MSWQDPFDAGADAVCMYLLGAVVHRANHSSLLSRYDFVHLQSERAYSADVQLSQIIFVPSQGLVAFYIAAESHVVLSDA